MSNTNKWRDLLTRESFSTGIYHFIPSEAIVEIAARAGLDFMIFDTEHASYDLAYIERATRVAEGLGLVTVVRIPGTQPDPHMLTRILDIGVDGLMFSRIESAAVAKDIVDLCRIPPIGKRGPCPGSRSGGYALSPLEDYRRRTNDISIMVMIETRRALEEAREILSLPGIDGVSVGRDDLAAALGLPGGRDDPGAYEAEREIFRIAKELGVGVRASATTPEELQMYLENENCPHVFSFLTDSYQIGHRIRELVTASHRLVEEHGLVKVQ